MTTETANEVVFLTGLVRWASIPPAAAKKPHEDAIKESEPENCSYEIEVECSNTDYVNILKKIGKKPGDSYTPTLRAYPEDVVNKRSKEVMATATNKTFLRVKASKIRGETVFKDIPVVDKTGATLTDKVGNDSTATVKIAIEPVKKGSNKKTLRLKAVQVLKLIPYVGGGNSALEGFTFEEADEVVLSQQHAQHIADDEPEF